MIIKMTSPFQIVKKECYLIDKCDGWGHYFCFKTHFHYLCNDICIEPEGTKVPFFNGSEIEKNGFVQRGHQIGRTIY